MSVPGEGFHHGPEYPQRAGDGYGENREIYRHRGVHHHGGPERERLGCRMGQAEVRGRMDQSGLCGENIRKATWCWNFVFWG